MTAPQSFFIVKLNRVDPITLCGVLSSALSVAASLAGRFELALFLLFLAMLSDAFDGYFARKWGLERPFGRYLDGFVDVLAYLVAPTLLLWQWGFQGVLAGLTLVAFIMSGIVRLSVFNEVGNVKEDGKLGYLGMPVFWSSFLVGALWLLALATTQTVAFIAAQILFPIYTVLMVHHGYYWKPKTRNTILAMVGTGLVIFGALTVRTWL